MPKCSESSWQLLQTRFLSFFFETNEGGASLQKSATDKISIMLHPVFIGGVIRSNSWCKSNKSSTSKVSYICDDSFSTSQLDHLRNNATGGLISTLSGGDTLSNIACYLQCGFSCCNLKDPMMPNVLKACGNCYRQDFNNVASGFHWWSDQKQVLMQVNTNLLPISYICDDSFSTSQLDCQATLRVIYTRVSVSSTRSSP